MDQLDILTEPVLELETLSLAGIPYGSRAADSVDRDRISQVTLSPIVHGYRGGAGIEPEYHGADGGRLTLDEVIDSVIGAHGILHLPGQVSVRVAGGRVVGFALYGASRGPLAHFGFLTSYADFLTTFGTPDRATRREVHNDLLGYDNYYWGARKQAHWDSFFDELSLVNLGGYEGNDRPRPA